MNQTKHLLIVQCPHIQLQFFSEVNGVTNGTGTGMWLSFFVFASRPNSSEMRCLSQDNNSHAVTAIDSLEIYLYAKQTPSNEQQDENNCYHDDGKKNLNENVIEIQVS